MLNRDDIIKLITKYKEELEALSDWINANQATHGSFCKLLNEKNGALWALTEVVADLDMLIKLKGEEQ